MELLLNLPTGEPVPVSEVYLTRALGQALRWRFVVALRPEAWGEQERVLVQRIGTLLVGEPCKVRASWRNGQTVELGSEATVVGASREPAASTTDRPGAAFGQQDRTTAVHYIEIDADGTFVEPRPDPFLPRRRVHKVKNMKELLDRLNHVAQPLGALLTELERIEFPDGENASIVQDGVSDWLFVFHIFDQCQWLSSPDARWLPLTLVGGADVAKGTLGRWVATPGLKSAYEQWGTVAERTIRYDDSSERDGQADLQFGRLPYTDRVPEFPGGDIPCVIDRRPERTFDAGRWKTWRTMDLPRFAENGAMVWRIEDRLFAGATSLGWESRTYTVPAEARIVGPERPGRLRPWTGLGRVEKTSPEGPWVTVRLPGFEDNEDLVNVRIGTPYSGSNGQRGLHMVPEEGTEVLLAWSGRFDQSIVLVGNARSEAAEHPSPSTYLEAEHTAQYSDIHVVKVGDTIVDSKFDFSVKQRTDINSAQQLQVKADGADLKMSSGIVHTGRG